MASEQQVKKYLVYWFQLGKKVLLQNGQVQLLPQPVMRGSDYSVEFERCWQQILLPESGDCYLEGTTQTIQQLLAPNWEITPCARCSMPVPTITLGISSLDCPCNDLSGWPNSELPQPRSPVSNTEHLSKIQQRLNTKLDHKN